MITVLTGENDFELVREVRELIEGFDGEAERIDGSNVQPQDMPDIFLGTTLFAEKRLIVIRNLSENKAAWAALPDFLPAVSDTLHLVLVEPKPDKRTKTYKALQKQTDIREHKPWSEREVAAAERWTMAEAGHLSLSLTGNAARLLVQRSMVAAEKGVVIDQWRLMSALTKLAPLGTAGPSEVEAYIEPAPIENVFGLLETALQGDASRVREMIQRLEISDDPFRLFGLLSGQVFWLAALSAGGKPAEAVAKEIGAHPYVLGKLAPYAKRLGVDGAKGVTHAFAEADTKMKTSAIDPWVLLERALIKTASLAA